jgi:hypothetical protein
MKNFLLTVLVINVFLTACCVLMLNYLDDYSAVDVSNFLFYVTIVLWIVAKLTWEGSANSRNWSVGKAEQTARSMVKGHDFDQDLRDAKSHNFSFGFTLFISGIPPIIGCVLIQLSL